MEKWTYPVIAVILLFTVGYALGTLATPRVVYKTKTVPQVVVKPMKDSNITYSTMYVPAVDQTSEGVITAITVGASKGTGQTLTNIDRILFWVDTQQSILTSRAVAQNITGLNLDEYDLIYTITANASVIEGPSAGAAITITTISALWNRTLNPNVTITGLIRPDGSIGPAGGITEKARSAEANNMTLFLVPKGTLKSDGTEREKSCRQLDGSEYCEVVYVPKKTDGIEGINIEVREVENISEALEYFMGE